MSQIDDRVVGRLTFPTAVPRPVVVGTVPVVLAVVLIVFVVVRHQVAHREPVMGGDEVHTVSGIGVEVLGAGQSSGESLHTTGRHPPEVADVVAEVIVPLAPVRTPLTNLVPVGTDVPRLGDVLDLAEHRVMGQGLFERMVLIDAMGSVPNECRGQIEAEAVHPHLRHPVAQRVEHHVEHLGLGGVQGIAASSDVVVITTVLVESVVGGVVDSPEGQGGALMTTLTGVVVDDVEDDLDACPVEGSDHGLELVDLLAETSHRAVGRMGGEESQGVVAPVVAQSLGHAERFGDEVVDRQQFHRRHPQTHQVLDHCRIRQAGVGATQVIWNQGVGAGVALDVHLVDDGLVHRSTSGNRLGSW